MSKLHEATGLGQSTWLNGLDRPFIHSHRLLELLQLGVDGVTTQLDQAVNARLDEASHKMAGIATAKVLYGCFQQHFSAQAIETIRCAYHSLVDTVINLRDELAATF